MDGPSPTELSGIHKRSVTLRWSVAATALIVGGCGILSSPPDPASDEIVAARDEQTQLMDSALSEAAAKLPGAVIGRSSVDQCYEGQRNWKVDTGYDYRCSLLISVLIGLDGDFRAQMLQFDKSLRELGWESDNGEWPGGLVDDYWELRSGEGPDGHVQLDQLPGPFGVRRDELRILFSYGSSNDEGGLATIDRGQQATPWCCGLPLYESQAIQDVDRVVAEAPHDHFVLITVEGHYYESG